MINNQPIIYYRDSRLDKFRKASHVIDHIKPPQKAAKQPTRTRVVRTRKQK